MYQKETMSRYTGKIETTTAERYRMTETQLANTAPLETATVLMPYALSPSMSTMPLVTSRPVLVRKASSAKMKDEPSMAPSAMAPP